MLDSFVVAESILQTLMSNEVPSITHLKLQKLLYYCQAWSLVFFEEKLFEEEIQAWVHGPVVPKVYRFYKKYGYSDISGSSFDPQTREKQKKCAVVKSVCEVYGGCSPKYLEELTHHEYPWLKARKGLLATQKSNKAISTEDMRKYYSLFVSRNHPNTINPLVVKKTKNRIIQAKAKIWPSFIQGMSTVMEIFPNDSNYLDASFFQQSELSGVESDLEALSSDWEKIGSDLSNAFESVKDDK